MYWLTKHLTVDNGTNELRFACCMLGLIGMCLSTPALADPLYGQVEDLVAPLALPDDLNEAMSDADLSAINGKGSELTILDGSERLAVILWDERGNDDRQGTHNNINGNQGFQSVTYNR